MMWLIALSTAASTGFIVEWAQRRCEQWARERDAAS
jgi:hypothetical protein